MLTIKRQILLAKSFLVIVILSLILTSAAIAQAVQNRNEVRKEGAKKVSEVAIPKRFSWEIPGWEAIFAAVGVGYYVLASLFLPHLIEIENKEESSGETATSGRDFSHRYSADSHS